MAVSCYADLIHHVGHRLAAVTYGDEAENVTIECLKCNDVLVGFDQDTEEDKRAWVYVQKNKKKKKKKKEATIADTN